MNQYTRRDWMKIGGLAVAGGALGVSGSRLVRAAEAPQLEITTAGYRYDRVEALVDGRARVEGCGLEFEVDSIGNLNTHVVSGPQTREVSEIGLHPFMLAYANDGFRDYTLIPVFPLRVFRHRSIFIRTDRGIERAEDLRGKKVATPGYSSTSLTWIRGILEHEYGVRPSDVEWFVSSEDSSAAISGGASKHENVMPEGLTVEAGPEGKDESDMLADGDVDALFHAIEPRAIVEGHPKVTRLFPNYRQTERDYFARTRMFPIMHAVAIRKDVVAKYPWLIESVFEAYSQAKQLAYGMLQKAGGFNISLPWVSQELEETRSVMGQNHWSYGLTSDNRQTLDALFQYSHEQGLASRRLTVEELFHPSALGLQEKPA